MVRAVLGLGSSVNLNHPPSMILNDLNLLLHTISVRCNLVNVALMSQ